MKTSTNIRIGIAVAFLIISGIYVAFSSAPVYLNENNCTTLIFQKYPEFRSYDNELDNASYELTEEGGYSKNILFITNRSYGYVDIVDNDNAHGKIVGCYIVSYGHAIENRYDNNYYCGIKTAAENSITNSTIYYTLSKKDMFVEIDIGQAENSKELYSVTEMTTFYSPALYTDKVEKMLRSEICSDDIFSIFAKKRRR